MINVDFFQFNQYSLFFFLIAALGLIRERMVLPFMIVILGAILKGEIAAVLIAALVVLTRLETGAPPWLRFKDALSLFCLMVGTAVNPPYREFVLSFGLLGLSFHNQNDRLGIIPSLLLVHLYFETVPFLEVVLGAAAFFVVLKQILILAKSPHERKILQWLEVPVLLCILFPLKDWGMIWLEDQTLVVLGSVLVFSILSLALWVKLKAPDFLAFYSRLHQKGLSWANFSSGFFSDRKSWISEEEANSKLAIQNHFDLYFWWTTITALLWALAVFVTKGGLN